MEDFDFEELANDTVSKLGKKEVPQHFTVMFRKIGDNWQYLGSLGNFYSVTAHQFNVLYGDSVKSLNMECWEEGRLYLTYPITYEHNILSGDLSWCDDRITI